MNQQPNGWVMPPQFDPQGRLKRQNKVIKWVIGSLVAGVIVVAGGVSLAQYEPTDPAVEAAAAAEASEEAEFEAFWAEVAEQNRAIKEKSAQDTKHFYEHQEKVTGHPPPDHYVEAQDAVEWAPAGDGLYFQFADKSAYSCDYLSCVAVYVMTLNPDGCLGGIYVEASVDRNGVSVGMANNITASRLPEGKVALVKLEDTTGEGDDMTITTLNCWGS